MKQKPRVAGVSNQRVLSWDGNSSFVVSQARGRVGCSMVYYCLVDEVVLIFHHFVKTFLVHDDYYVDSSLTRTTIKVVDHVNKIHNTV